MAAPNIANSAIPTFDHTIVVTSALTPAAVVKATCEEQTFTVTGLSTGSSLQASDQILAVNKPTAQSGLGIVNARVTAANTVGITFINPTAADITPTAGETYTFVVYRPSQPAVTTATVV